MECGSEATYIRQQRDQATVALHDRLDGLAEKIETLKLGVSMDTAIRHEEDFEAIKQEVVALRVIADRLAD